MARGYTKEDVIGAYLMRFIKAGLDITVLEKNAEVHYDKVGKDKFREAASVDAAVMKEYFQWV